MRAATAGSGSSSSSSAKGDLNVEANGGRSSPSSEMQVTDCFVTWAGAGALMVELLDWVAWKIGIDLRGRNGTGGADSIAERDNASRLRVANHPSGALPLSFDA